MNDMLHPEGWLDVSALLGHLVAGEKVAMGRMHAEPIEGGECRVWVEEGLFGRKVLLDRAEPSEAALLFGNCWDNCLMSGYRPLPPRLIIPAAPEPDSTGS